MRLFLSDTFYDAVLELPKEIQKKVVAFQKKLREDPTSKGLHIEPIKGVKNETMRTARVDDKYRVVLGILGEDSYHLLYVGNHENAYDWSMRKRLVWNEHTQTTQLVSINDIEDTPTFKEEKTQNENSYLFEGIPKEKILNLGVPEDMLDKVMQIHSLEDLDALEEDLPTDAFENLFNLHDGGNIDDIIAEIKEGQAQGGEDKLLSNNNKRRFVELTDDDALQNIIDQDLDKWQIFLHPSQRKLVDADYKGTMKVSGGAGTGKTIAAIHRLKHLCEDANAKVLFTTYTLALSENLRGLIKKMDINPSRYNLGNIDKVLLQIANEFKVKQGYKVLDYLGDKGSLKLWREILETQVTSFDEEFLYDEYIYVIVYFGNTDLKQYLLQQRIGRTKALSRKQRMEVWGLIEKYVALKNERKVVDRLELFNEVTKYLNENNIHPYTNVIADEFQDFSNPELKFLRALVAEGRNDLFLTGDPLQRIYSGRKINFSTAGINVRGFRSRRLKINYRTTEPIRRVAMSVVKGLSYDDMDGGVESTSGYVSLIHGGEKPIYEMVGNVNEEIEKIIGWINTCKESGINYTDICVTAPSKGLMKELSSRFHKDNIPYLVVEGANKTGSIDGITLCTFHSLKGLEFKVIILMEVNERNLPSKVTDTYPFIGMDEVDKKEFFSSKRSLLYVAITRARQLVFMIGFGEPTGLIKIE